MAASTITRGTFVDGTTPWNSSNISSLIYDRIDQMFSGVGGYATLELGGALKINGALTQLSNDGGALGTSSLGWSDLFLASGGVINWNNGDVTLTHSTNTLTFGGAASGYIFNDGNVGIGVTPSAWASTFKVLQIGTGAFISGQASGAQDTLHMGANFFWDGSNWKYIGSLAATQMRTSGGAFIVATAPSGTAGNNITFTDRFRVLEGGNIAIGATARFYLDGTAGTGDTYQEESAANVYQVVVGGTTKMRAAQTGISVSTSATTILDDAGGLGSLVVVNGNSGSNRFCDLVLASTATAPTVVSSYTSLGTPSARTYTRSGDALQLAMASGTYAVHTVKFGS